MGSLSEREGRHVTRSTLPPSSRSRLSPSDGSKNLFAALN
jgi:hypothetical protein